MDIKMSIFKKPKDTNTQTISTDGENVNVTVYSYLVYKRDENRFIGSIKLTEEQATQLNSIAKSVNVDNTLSFVRS